MINVNGYPGYTYKEGILYNPKGKEQHLIATKGSGSYKVKNDEGKWVQLSRVKLLTLVGEVLELPKTAKQIPGCDNYYIDIYGNVYSFSKSYPNGKKLKTHIGTKGYPVIGIITSEGKRRTVEVHQLLAQTFISKNYIQDGFVVMHKDDNKEHCTLDNICVGTYSQNNKDAYTRGLNKGNILGINSNK